MRIRHSPDASTFPGFKQGCLDYIMFFRNNNKLHKLSTGICAAIYHFIYI